MKNKLISVVTPVYNGAPFLQDAYRCLCAQTYTDWEWVVVNDGSTDDTEALITELAASDPRISHYRQPNSGSAKRTRDHAVYESHGSYIVPLDVDDHIEAQYLEKLSARQAETGADIVYPEMHFIDMPTGKCTLVLPVADFDTSRVYSGRELVRETMPEWRIGCNGGLYRREAWINLSWPDPVPVTSDEVDERLYQLHAHHVAFAPAIYFYQNHDGSYTQKVAPKNFVYRLTTNLELADVIDENFAPDSEERRLMSQRLLYGWRSLMALYARSYRQLVGANDLIEALLRQSFMRIDAQELSRTERIKFLHLSSYQLLFALFCLKYSPTLLFEKMLGRIAPNLYRWLFIRRRIEKQLTERIATSYQAGKTAAKAEPFVACIHCGNAMGGGLADRLRGIVSTFMVCRAQGLPFKIYFTHPFLLSDYLEPNEYDWLATDEQMCFTASDVNILVCDTQTDTKWERAYQQRYFSKQLARHQHRQQHVYTNAAFAYEADFRALFNQLFKPTALLQRHIDDVQKDIGTDYITVSMRFCNLLGDFNEEVYGLPLPVAGQEALIEGCIAQIERLHEQHPDHRIVVCSDSTTMLSRAITKEYVYEIEGKVSHIGNDGPHDYQYYEKTFLDFFTIVRADAVYLLMGQGMMRSGFPYAAALLGGKRCEVIAF